MNIFERLPYDRIISVPDYQRWLAVGVIHILLFTGYFFFLYKGKVNRIDSLTDNLNNIEKELKKNRLRRKRLPELKEKIDKLNFKLLIARTQLPGSKEVPELLEQISNLGRSSGLEFLLFKPQKEIPKDFYTEVPVQMKVSGTFHDITNFFDKLGNFARIVNISNIKMGNAKRKGERTIIQASCSATTFMFTGGKDAITEENKTYLNNMAGFSIQHHKDWVIEEIQGPNSEVIFTSPKSKKGYRANIHVKVIKNEDNMNRLIEKDKYDAGIFKDEYKIISEEDIPTDNFTTYQITARFIKDRTALIEKTTYISKDNKKIFKIIATATEGDFKEREALFDNMTNSFWIHSADDFKRIGEERFWTIPESTYSPTGKRDPFNSLLITEEMIARIEIEEEDEEGRIKTPLEMFDTLSLKLVGIIWDNESKRIALIETSDGKGYVVTPGTRLGKRHGRIKDITKDSVIVEERRKFRIGNKIQVNREMVVLKLRTDKDSSPDAGVKVK